MQNSVHRSLRRGVCDRHAAHVASLIKSQILSDTPWIVAARQNAGFIWIFPYHRTRDTMGSCATTAYLSPAFSEAPPSRPACDISDAPPLCPRTYRILVSPASRRTNTNKQANKMRMCLIKKTANHSPSYRKTHDHLQEFHQSFRYGPDKIHLQRLP